MQADALRVDDPESQLGPLADVLRRQCARRHDRRDSIHVALHPDRKKRFPGSNSIPWIFAAKTTASGLIALLVAFSFNLDEPYWRWPGVAKIARLSVSAIPHLFGKLLDCKLLAAYWRRQSDDCQSGFPGTNPNQLVKLVVTSSDQRLDPRFPSRARVFGQCVELIVVQTGIVTQPAAAVAAVAGSPIGNYIGGNLPSILFRGHQWNCHRWIERNVAPPA